MLFSVTDELSHFEHHAVMKKPRNQSFFSSSSERCPSNIRCRDGGFVDQNCKCICPDGSKNCQEGQESTSNNADEEAGK